MSTLPVINHFSHQRKIEITASPADGVSQGEAIARCQQILVEVQNTIDEDRKKEVLPSTDFPAVELGNAQAMHETIRSLIFALVTGIIIAYMILGVQFNSFEDHVHLCVSIAPTILISEFIGQLKGSSAHEANQKLAHKALEWQTGYGVVSFGEYRGRGEPRGDSFR